MYSIIEEKENATTKEHDQFYKSLVSIVNSLDSTHLSLNPPLTY